MREYAREEHVNWIEAMRILGSIIGMSVNDLPREEFINFENALRDWAISYVRMGGN